jgi:acyl-CoA dehydrogenase
LDFRLPDEVDDVRRAVRELCAAFGGEYWRGLEPDGYPQEFVDTLTREGWLSVLIPEEYGGAGLGLRMASVVLEEIHASGGNAAACHAQMYTMGTLLRQSDKQKVVAAADRPRVTPAGVRGGADRRLRDDCDLDLRAAYRHRLLDQRRRLPARTPVHYGLLAPLGGPGRQASDGLSVFLVDLVAGDHLTIRPIKTMMNHSTARSSSTASKYLATRSSARRAEFRSSSTA